MFSHIQLSVRDLTRMQQFYDSVLAELGLVRVPEEGVGEAGVIWHRAERRWPQFVRAPLNGLPATWANGSQVSFAALAMGHQRHQIGLSAAGEKQVGLFGGQQRAVGFERRYRGSVAIHIIADF